MKTSHINFIKITLYTQMMSSRHLKNYKGMQSALKGLTLCPTQFRGDWSNRANIQTNSQRVLGVFVKQSTQHPTLNMANTTRKGSQEERATGEKGYKRVKEEQGEIKRNGFLDVLQKGYAEIGYGTTNSMKLVIPLHFIT